VRLPETAAARLALHLAARHAASGEFVTVRWCFKGLTDELFD
jgi:hypothetical protein